MGMFFMVSGPATLAQAQETSNVVVDYAGELIDQNAAPISGVLPLEFRIYADQKSKKAIATEKLFVAVVDGTYAVTLGENTPIKSKANALTVAVYLDGKELTRQQVSTQRQIVSTHPKMVTTETIGSQGGETFRLECPAGYVATGIEGDAKAGFQGLRVICSKTR